MASHRLPILLSLAVITSAICSTYLGQCEHIENHLSALCRAAETGDVSAMRRELSAHPELLDASDLVGATALHSAAWGGHRAAVELLLRCGANANLADCTGTTPLHLAVAGGQADIVREILDKGADPNAAESSGITPLEIADHKANTRIIRLLIEHGADRART